MAASTHAFLGALNCHVRNSVIITEIGAEVEGRGPKTTVREKEKERELSLLS